MSNARHLTLGALTLATLATVVGCGQPGTTGAPTDFGMLAASAPNTVMAAGKLRKLGFDMKRYKTVFAPRANKTHAVRQGATPPAVDLRSEQAPVYDQGQLGACTAFSIAKGFREHLQRANHEQQTPLSALWFYYNERAAQGSIKQDSGSTLTEGFKVLSTKGVATDATDPYNIANFKLAPPAAADATAAANRITAPVQLSNLDDIKAALASHQDVSLGFTVHASFRNIGPDGMMPVPKTTEQVLGGHAVCAVGYDDSKQVLIVRNSWNTTWGAQGYFYMPYAVVQRDADDFWTAAK